MAHAQEPITNMTMSETQFKTLLASMGSVNIKKGSFTGCTARYKGVTQTAKVEEFITVTTIYKDIEKISDENALNGLPLLLQDTAATWWQGVKGQINTWDNAMDLLRKTFAPAKPPYKLYMEIFEKKQAKDASTDLFVCDKRALFAQIPNQHRPNDHMQLDMIYGLLHMDIRQTVVRDSFTSYDKLLVKARAAEAILVEKANSSTVTNTTTFNQKPREVVKCSYCKNRGHTEDMCRKKQTTEAAKTNRQVEIKKEETQSVACYGCGWCFP